MSGRVEACPDLHSLQPPPPEWAATPRSGFWRTDPWSDQGTGLEEMASSLSSLPALGCAGAPLSGPSRGWQMADTRGTSAWAQQPHEDPGQQDVPLPCWLSSQPPRGSQSVVSPSPPPCWQHPPSTSQVREGKGASSLPQWPGLRVWSLRRPAGSSARASLPCLAPGGWSDHCRPSGCSPRAGWVLDCSSPVGRPSSVPGCHVQTVLS